MDYKKIIKSRAVRVQMMRAMSFVPDRWMVKLQYWIKTGRRLDLKDPKRYTEKLQWYKLHYRDPLMAQCADKYAVRDYVKSMGLEGILNTVYGVFDAPEEIDWEKLPRQFVAKDTLGSGGNDVLICKDKTKLDKTLFYRELARWVQPVKGKHPGREWVYDNARHRILIEKFIENGDGDLPDYKFFCFQGRVEYFYIRNNYMKHHDQGQMAFFDKDKKYLPGYGFDYCSISDAEIQCPEDLDKMIEISERLAQKFPHVRVDLYKNGSQILFGELTFFNASGYMKVTPDEFDRVLGDKFKIGREK